MIVYTELDPRTRRSLEDIQQRYASGKPSVVIADMAGELLVESTASPLPVVLSEISHAYTLAMVLRECDRGAISPDTPIADILPLDIVSGLCVIGDRDLSSSITIEHLLSHQSGIPDFYHRRKPGTISFSMQTTMRDRKWNLEQALEIAKHYPGVFPPGSRGKIHYSLTNYALLGAILQESTGMNYDQLINLRVVVPLGLKGTFVFTEAHYDRYFSLAAIHRGVDTLRIPRTLASFGAAGSVVATPKDMVTFWRALVRGELFDASWIEFLHTDPRKLFANTFMTKGLMVPAQSRRRSSTLAYAGSSGQAVISDESRGVIAFLALNTVSEPHDSLALVSTLVTSMPPVSSSD